MIKEKLEIIENSELAMSALVNPVKESVDDYGREATLIALKYLTNSVKRLSHENITRQVSKKP
jgi:hypothetical protein